MIIREKAGLYLAVLFVLAVVAVGLVFALSANVADEVTEEDVEATEEESSLVSEAAPEMPLLRPWEPNSLQT